MKKLSLLLFLLINLNVYAWDVKKGEIVKTLFLIEVRGSNAILINGKEIKTDKQIHEILDEQIAKIGPENIIDIKFSTSMVHMFLIIYKENTK